VSKREFGARSWQTRQDDLCRHALRNGRFYQNNLPTYFSERERLCSAAFATLIAIFAPADRFAQVSGDAILMVEHSLPDGLLHRDTGVRECEAREFCSKPRWPLFVLTVYSTSVGSLNKTVSLMLPCPNCGYPVAAGLPGSRFEAVSSGGNNTSEFRKASRAADLPGGSAA
jgi:hypothetical protein